MYSVIVDVADKGTHKEMKCDAFDVSISVPDVKTGIPLIKGMIEQAGVRMKREGKDLPKEMASADQVTGNVICMVLDFDKLLREKVTTSVRRTITLPEWMDLEVREKHIDASKLFREAFIEKYGDIDEVKITTVDELEQRVDHNLLREYVNKYVKAAFEFSE